MINQLAPLTLYPRPSRELIRLLSLIQALTLVVVLCAPIPLNFMLLLLSAFLLQVLASQRRLRGLTRDRIIGLHIDHAHSSHLTLTDGRELETRLRGDSLVTPWLILLRFEGEGLLRRPSLLLGRDSLNKCEMRHLRILLRFGGVSSKAESSFQ
jgi:hypothetical protein